MVDRRRRIASDSSATATSASCAWRPSTSSLRSAPEWPGPRASSASESSCQICSASTEQGRRVAKLASARGAAARTDRDTRSRCSPDFVVVLHEAPANRRGASSSSTLSAATNCSTDRDAFREWLERRARRRHFHPWSAAISGAKVVGGEHEPTSAMALSLATPAVGARGTEQRRRPACTTEHFPSNATANARLTVTTGP